MTPRQFVLIAVLTAVLAGVAGCASDPRYSKGLQWILEDQREKAALQAQGFPQYSWP